MLAAIVAALVVFVGPVPDEVPVDLLVLPPVPVPEPELGAPAALDEGRLEEVDPGEPDPLGFVVLPVPPGDAGLVVEGVVVVVVVGGVVVVGVVVVGVVAVVVVVPDGGRNEMNCAVATGSGRLADVPVVVLELVVVWASALLRLSFAAVRFDWAWSTVSWAAVGSSVASSWPLTT